MATLNDLCETSARLNHLLPLATVAERVDSLLADGGTLHHKHGIVNNERGIIRRNPNARFLAAALKKLSER